jgi:hypothetical protein
MNLIWDEQGECVAKQGDRGQGIVRRNVYLDGRVREAGEVFTFEICKVPENKFQTQQVTIKTELNSRFGESVYPWYLTNAETLP